MSAVVQEKEKPEIKLDLGCGKNKQKGFLGIDSRQFDGVDGVSDLTKKTWMFNAPTLGGLDLEPIGVSWKLPDSSVTEVHCSHFFEHLDFNRHNPERVRFINELYRVLIPGGKASIITPHWASQRAFGDFTHADKPVSEFFYYYVWREWRVQNAPHTDIEWNPDGFDCDFNFAGGYSLHSDMNGWNDERKQYAQKWYKEACLDCHMTVTSNKKAT